MSKRKNPPREHASKFKIHNKEKINHVLHDMGLKQPVSTKRNKAKKEKKQKKKQVTVSLKEQLNYSRNGHGCIRSLLEPSTLQGIKTQLIQYANEKELEAWQQKVEVATNSPKVANSCQTIQACRDKLDALLSPTLQEQAVPFLQHFNTFKSIPIVKELACDSVLPRIASIVMDVSQVRLYQDSLFWKRHHDGPTPWHVDGRMTPFDTSQIVTFWIPLQDVGRNGTALEFVSKSHADFSLAFWNDFDSREFQNLEHRYRNNDIVNYMPMSLGDVTMHSGWTLHCSRCNHNNVATQSQQDRLALAITYVDANAEIRHNATKTILQEDNYGNGLGDNEDYWSYKDWISDVPPRQPFGHHPLVPIVRPKS